METFQYSKIVVTRTQGLGDVVMTTPILYGLRKKFPDAKISFVIYPNAYDLVSKLDFIDEIVVFPDKKTLKDQIKILKLMWYADLVYLIDTSHRLSVISFLSRAKKRIGLKHKRGIYLTDGIEYNKKMDSIYDPVLFAEILKEITKINIMDTDDWNRFFVSEANAEEINKMELLKNNNGIGSEDSYIIFSMYTANRAKDLPEYKWQNIWEKFAKISDMPIVLCGNNPKKIKFSQNVKDFSNKTNLRELGYLIKKSALVINGCSLPMHIARAFDIPTIGLYGPTFFEKGAPPENFVSISSPAYCAPCWTMYSDPCKEPFCMDMINEEIILDALKNFLITRRLK